MKWEVILLIISISIVIISVVIVVFYCVVRSPVLSLSNFVKMNRKTLNPKERVVVSTTTTPIRVKFIQTIIDDIQSELQSGQYVYQHPLHM